MGLVCCKHSINAQITKLVAGAQQRTSGFHSARRDVPEWRTGNIENCMIFPQIYRDSPAFENFPLPWFADTPFEVNDHHCAGYPEYDGGALASRFLTRRYRLRETSARRPDGLFGKYCMNRYVNTGGFAECGRAVLSTRGGEHIECGCPASRRPLNARLPPALLPDEA